MRAQIPVRVLLGLSIGYFCSCRPHPPSARDPSSLTKNSPEPGHPQSQTPVAIKTLDPSASQAQHSKSRHSIPKKSFLTCTKLQSEASTIDFSWIPQDTRTFVLAQTGHPQWEPSVRRFEQWLRQSENAKRLPLRVKFGLSLLRTESELIHRLLDSIADTSNLFLKIMPPKGQGFWTWHHACDLNRLAETMRQAWDLEIRQDLKARIGVSTRSELLPFEVLMLSGGKGIFAAPGSHASILSWLEKPSSASLTTKVEIDVESRLASVRNKLHRSPLVILSPSNGFLGTSNTNQTTQAPLQIIVQNQEIWINGIRDETLIGP